MDRELVLLIEETLGCTVGTNSSDTITIDYNGKIDMKPYQHDDYEEIRKIEAELAAWRKTIYGKLNRLLLGNPNAKRINISKRVVSVYANQTCKFCHINLTYVNCTCDHRDVNECRCYRCPKGIIKNPNIKQSPRHKPKYYKLYNGIILTTKSIRKALQFNPEKTKEFSAAMSLLIIYNRKVKVPSVVGTLAKDILYIIVNMILEPISIWSGSRHRYRRK